MHIEVPAQFTREGIGGALVRAAVEWAATERLVVSPRCSFARSWLTEHPDVAATVTIDWDPPTH